MAIQIGGLPVARAGAHRRRVINWRVVWGQVGQILNELPFQKARPLSVALTKDLDLDARLGRLASAKGGGWRRRQANQIVELDESGAGSRGGGGAGDVDSVENGFSCPRHSRGCANPFRHAAGSSASCGADQTQADRY